MKVALAPGRGRLCGSPGLNPRAAGAREHQQSDIIVVFSKDLEGSLGGDVSYIEKYSFQLPSSRPYVFLKSHQTKMIYIAKCCSQYRISQDNG